MRITLEFRPPLSDKAANLRQLAEQGFFESLGRLAQETEAAITDALRQEAPVRTGQLRDEVHSVQTTHYGGGVTLQWRTVDYARFVLEGTRPHEIVPRTASVLAFYGADGTLVFTRHVDHPGTRPNPFNERSWAHAREEVLEIMARTGREFLRQAAA